MHSYYARNDTSTRPPEENRVGWRARKSVARFVKNNNNQQCITHTNGGGGGGVVGEKIKPVSVRRPVAGRSRRSSNAARLGSAWHGALLGVLDRSPGVYARSPARSAVRELSRDAVYDDNRPTATDTGQNAKYRHRHGRRTTWPIDVVKQRYVSRALVYTVPCDGYLKERERETDRRTDRRTE